MKKRNFAIQTAIATAVLMVAAGAQAGNMATTTRTFATENFGPTQAATVAITPATISYAISNAGGVTVANGQTITLYLRLSSPSVFSTAPLVGQFSSLAIGINAALVAPSSVSWTAGATAGTVSVTYTAAASNNLPVNTAIIYTPIAGAVTATSSTLATAGGSVTVIGSLDGGVPSNASTTLPASQDPVGPAAVIAVSAAAITATASSSGAFPFRTLGVVETKRIDLGAAPSGATFAPAATNTALATLIDLGGYAFTNNPTVTPTTLAGTNYALPAANSAAVAPFASTAVTVTPVTGTFPIGSTLTLASYVACTTFISAASAAFTTLTAGTAVVLQTTGTDLVPGSGVPGFVCLTVPGTVAGVITPLTTTVSAVLSKSTATDGTNATGAVPLYALGYNGSLRDVRSYIPASSIGYTSFVRVINTGSLTANVTGQWLYENGTPGTAAVLIASHPAGGVITLTSAQIEAALGAPAVIGNNRPRLRLTAPTTGLEAQSFFLTNANGNFSDVTGAQ